MISRLIIDRLKVVLLELISSFLGGRRMEDFCLTREFVIEHGRKNTTPKAYITLDFHKAFNFIHWSFIDIMLAKFGFCYHFRNQIKECAKSMSFSILVEVFHATRGIR